jgi:hypothetical protein
VIPAHAERNWINLGRSTLGPWDIFVDKDSIRKMDDNVYAAISYQDLGVVQRGLDEFDSKGRSIFNTKIRYRSYRSIGLYDCKNNLTGHLETRYYLGSKPSKETLVHVKKESDPVWLNIIVEPKIFNYVCNKMWNR